MIEPYILAKLADEAKVQVRGQINGVIALPTLEDWKRFAAKIDGFLKSKLQIMVIECPDCGYQALPELNEIFEESTLTPEQSELLTIGHCPWDVTQQDESDPLPEPHCHANRDGDCTFVYCPQSVLRNVRQQLSKIKGSERYES